MASNRIRKKLLFMSFLMAGVAFVTSYSANWSINALENDLASSETISSVLRNHLEGDMMHDAIRADVIFAMLGATKGSQDDITAAEKDLNSHSENFLGFIENNQHLSLPPQVEQAIIQMRPSLDNYIKIAHDMIAAARSGRESVEALYPTFMSSFEDMERQQATVSQLLQSYIKSERMRSNKESHDIRIIVLGLSCISLLLIALLPFNIILWLLRPLQRMIILMQQLSNGNNQIEIPFINKNDEMGDIARAVQVFKDNALKVESLAHDQERQKQLAEEEKRKSMHKLANDFESSVKGVVDMVASAATEMDATSSSVAKIAQTSRNKLSDLVGDIESTTINVQTVAAAAKQLSNSVVEISQQVSRATTITSNAVNEAGKVDSTVQSLDQSAKKIGEVVSLIKDIAEQINLLALNATIEAARAGEAGKGFAVVASEVKNLANQTAKATEEIISYIESIQTKTSDTVTAIKGVTHTIREIDNISTNIAAAIEEQGAATADISRNVDQAAQRTSKVSESADIVNASASETDSAATQMQAASHELSKQAETLRSVVNRFLSGVRA